MECLHKDTQEAGVDREPRSGWVGEVLLLATSVCSAQKILVALCEWQAGESGLPAH